MLEFKHRELFPYKFWQREDIVRVYLDNCCYNRPFDNQNFLRISLETQAKLYIQKLIRDKKVELATSYMLRFENSKNPFETKRQTIENFCRSNRTVHIDASRAAEVRQEAAEMIKNGVKAKDACHVASAILAGCDYFISTDDKLLKHKSEKITMLNPVDFIRICEVSDDDN